MSLVRDSTPWKALALAADRGDLLLDQNAARKCSDACESYLEKLARRQKETEGLAKLSGWGDFTAGQQLMGIYASKASGGENSMVDVLQSHIDVVTEMKAVFDKFFTVTDDNEHQNASAIGSVGQNSP